MTRLVSRFLFAALLATGAAAQTPPPAPEATPKPAPAAPVLPKFASPPAIPTLGRLRVFSDWAVGCDNRLSCSAVSLGPDGAREPRGVLVWIGREGGPDGESTIEFSGSDELRGRIDLLVDGEAAGQMVAARDMAWASGPVAFRLIRRLGSSYGLELRQGKTTIATPSLNGLAEALRYIDQQQGRVGSEAALAAIGDQPADLAKPVPQAPALVLMADAAPPEGAPALTEEELRAARGLATCGGRRRDSLPVEAHPLDATHLLALVACDPGAENVSSIALIAAGEPGSRTFDYARFDLMPGFSGEPGTVPLVVNVSWNPARAALTSFAKGRALGDCGTSETYRWDGAMFRLVQARAMPVCRGAWEWPVLWSAVTTDAGGDPLQASASGRPAPGQLNRALAPTLSLPCPPRRS